jgi:hypothetical protein
MPKEKESNLRQVAGEFVGPSLESSEKKAEAFKQLIEEGSGLTLKQNHRTSFKRDGRWVYYVMWKVVK